MRYAKVENPNKNSHPVVRINPVSGEIVGFASMLAGAKALGLTKQSDLSAHSQKIGACCEKKTEDANGFYWRYGTLYVGIEDDAPKADDLVGSVVNGFLVKSNTGMRLPSGDVVYECECVECGAPRLVIDTSLKVGAVQQCSCVESLAILDKASPTSAPDLAESVRARLLSPKPQAEATKPWSIFDRDGMNGRKRVRQYTLDGEFIAEHASVVDAYAAVNPDKAKTLPRRKLQELSSCIASCCRGEAKKSQGFVWEYADGGEEHRAEEKPTEPKIEATNKPASELIEKFPGKRPTSCMDLNSGDLLEFDDVAAACAKIGARLERPIDPEYVAALCEKGGGAAYGYFWEFIKATEA